MMDELKYLALFRAAETRNQSEHDARLAEHHRAANDLSRKARAARFRRRAEALRRLARLLHLRAGNRENSPALQNS